MNEAPRTRSAVARSRSAATCCTARSRAAAWRRSTSRASWATRASRASSRRSACMPEFAEDSEFVAMFLDEARIASKVHHRNVVPVLDVVTTSDEVVLVQEYVHGAPLHWLLRTRARGEARTCRVDVAVVDRAPGARRPARRARDDRRAGHAARHRPSRRVAAERDGRDRRHGAPARLRRREGDDGRARHARGHVQGQARVLGARAAARQRDPAERRLLARRSCCGSCSSATACTASAQAEAELIAEIMTGKLPTVTEALAAERDMVGDRYALEAARGARADHPARASRSIVDGALADRGRDGSGADRGGAAGVAGRSPRG